METREAYRRILTRVKSGELNLGQALGEIQGGREPENDIIYLRPDWEEMKNSPSFLKEEGDTLLIAESLPSLARWQSSFRELCGGQLLCLLPGKTLAYSRPESMEIPFRDLRQWDTLLAYLCENYALRKIVFIFSGSQELHYGEDSEGILQDQIYPLFHLIRSLLRGENGQPLSLLIFNTAEGMLSPFYSACAGFVATLGRETNKIRGCFVRLEGDPRKVDARGVVGMSGSTDELQLLYRENAWYRPVFTKRLNGEVNPAAVFKENGVYLITGGAGGLGMALTAYLAGHFRLKLVLTGRSALRGSKAARLSELQREGVEISYLPSDITDAAAVGNLVKEILGKYKKIDGVVHAAGVIEDNYLINKDNESIRRVVEAKVRGAWNLHMALGNKELDFFVLYSSLSAFGNPGQIDYSYANSFLDAFAAARESLRREGKCRGKTVSVNWPYWEKGGMRLDGEALALMRHSNGLRPLAVAEGMEALLRAVAWETPQLLVLPGNREKIEHTFVTGGITGGGAFSAENKRGGIREQVLADLHTFSASLLKVTPQELETDVPLQEYGWDVLHYSDLVGWLNNHYNLELTSAFMTGTESLAGIADRILTEHPGLVPPPADSRSGGGPEVTPALKESVEEFLLEQIAASLKMEPGEYDPGRDMSEYGFDSTGFTRFAGIINAKYGLDITPALFFEHATLADFSGYLFAAYGDVLAAQSPPGESVKESSTAWNTSGGGEVRRAAPGFKKVTRFAPEPGETPPAGHPGRGTGEIAIIGMAGRMPGSTDLEEFWQHLFRKQDLITEVPAERWDWREYWGEPGEDNAKTLVKWGGFIRDLDKFDARFFGISPLEAEYMDPQQRILLESIWHLLEDAGFKASRLAGSSTAVFIGVQNMEYPWGSEIPLDAYISSGTSHAVLANRISYYFDFHGPSEAVDTACSSSLVAIHRAINAIKCGDCEMAVAGGVNALISPDAFIALDKGGMLSHQGRCKTFDAAANGYARAEGVGVVLLKPLAGALEDGDHIYAVIKGSAENHGGRAKSLTAPNPGAQAALIERAMRQAGINPTTVTYLETHGTGTSLGDPIEVNGLLKAFGNLYRQAGEDFSKPGRCGLGSVKTNVGHLETAAGMAGLFKILLAMRHEQLPGTVHFNQLNPYIELEGSPFYVLRDSQPWPKGKDAAGVPVPRRAGISSFGFGGANAHLVLEEWEDKRPACAGENEGQQLFIFSAKSELSLRHCLSRFRTWLRDKGDPPALRDIAYTLQEGRDELDCRLAVIATGYEDLIRKLGDYHTSGEEVKNVFYGIVSKKRRRLDSVLEDEEGREFVNRMTLKRDLPRIAQLWISGISVNWKHLYDGGFPRRIPLPGYAFRRQRFWLPSSEKKKRQLSHPLLDEDRSSPGKTVFVKTFYDYEFFARDHRYGENCVVPGMVLLEMVRAAGELSGKKKVTGFDNVLFGSPVIATRGGKQVAILFLEGEAVVNFEIRGKGTAGEIIHAQGSLSRGGPGKAEGGVVNLCELKEGLEVFSGVREVYRSSEKSEMKSFATGRVIKEVSYSDKRVLAKLEVADEVKDAGEYVLHPSLIDGSVQTISFWLACSQKKVPVNVLFSIGRMRIFRPLPSVVFVVNSTGQSIGVPLDQQRFRITICDEKGNILVLLEDVGYREVTVAALRQAGKNVRGEDASFLLLKPAWIPCALPPQQKEYDFRLVLFDSDELLFEELQKCFRDVILVKPGKKTGEIKPGVYELDSVSPGELASFLKPVNGQEAGPVHILFNWGKTDMEDGFPPEGVDYCLKTGILSLFRLVKTGLKSKIPDQSTKLICLHNRAGDGDGLFQSTFSGFLRTLRLENPAVQCKLLGFSESGQRPSAHTILAEFMHEFDDPEILLNGGRYRKTLVDCERGRGKGKLQQHGTYFISGGSGGLGLILAEYLLKEYQANIVLCARSEYPRSRLEGLERKEPGEGRILYYQVDVTSLRDLRRMSADLQQKGIAPRGIIHAAGVIRDAYIIKKDEKDFEAVLRPKIKGVINLDSVFKDHDLDFFALFSSTSAVFGNPGQGDYAAGNSFLDAFAVYRNRLQEKGKRRGVTVSMNWFLWKQGGMQVEEELVRMISRQTGMSPLDTGSGLAGFETALQSGEAQVLITSGDKTRLLRLLGDAPTRKTAGGGVEENEPSARGKLRDYLLNSIARVAKIPADELDPAENFAVYGVDSLLIMKLNNQLEKDLGPLPRTLLHEHNTVRELTDYLLHGKQEELMRLFGEKTEVGSSGAQSGAETGEGRITAYLVELVAGVSRLEAGQIDRNEKFSSYGIDSLMIMKLNTQLEKVFPGIPRTLFFEHDNIRSLAAYFLKNFPGVIEEATFPRIREKKGAGKAGEESGRKLSAGTADDYESELKKHYKHAFAGFYAEMKVVLRKSSRGVTYETFTIGEGEPLLLLTGVTLLAPTMLRQIRYFSTKYKVVLIHYPATGRSGYDAHTGDIRNLPAEYMDLLGGMGIEKKIRIAGWSLGGYIALMMAAGYPGAVEKVCLISTTHAAGGEEILEQGLDDIQQVKRRVPELGLSPLQQEAVLFSLSRGCRDEKLRYEYYNQALEFHFPEEKLGEIKIPSLVIAGSEDSLIPPEMSRLLSSKLGQAEYVEIPGAGHYIPLTHATLLNKYLDAFF